LVMQFVAISELRLCQSPVIYKIRVDSVLSQFDTQQKLQ
jgi:hypothetical protein